MERRALRKLIGRVLMVGIPGPELDASTRLRLTRLAAGGVVLFRRNVVDAKQLAALTAALHEVPSQPLIGIDHEGGRVLRVGAPFTEFPPMATVGALGDPDLARQVGRAMGRELAAAGIDINFAPVLDVHSNPDNPVIGDRAFSSDPTVVAAMGIALIRGLGEGGVIACGKHFPGHGDTATDSHLAMPVVHRDRVGLDRRELVPFRAAIAAGLPLIMTAHVLYPALDPERPATLSPLILRDLLRDRLGFRGVVVSDDLAMRAISDQYEAGAAAVQTLMAGADLLLLCNDLAQAEAAAEAIEAAIRNGALEVAVVTAAGDRVQRIARPVDRGAIALSDLPVPAHVALNDRLRAAALPPPAGALGEPVARRRHSSRRRVDPE